MQMRAAANATPEQLAIERNFMPVYSKQWRYQVLILHDVWCQGNI